MIFSRKKLSRMGECKHPCRTRTVVVLKTPEGRLGMSNVSPQSGIAGLSFDSTLLSHLFIFLPSPVALSVFILFVGHSPHFFQIILQYFSQRDSLLYMAPV